MKIKYRKSLGGYLMDEIMGVNQIARAQKQEELKILEKSRPAKTIECDICGRVGIIARCQGRSFFTKCDKALCKKHAKEGDDGKFYCKDHIEE